MYASLLISLLAAFIAMLGKQWLNRYMRNAGGSMIERCGDRQRKFDGLQKWPLGIFIESLPVMLQAALLLLACGLCQSMWSVNKSIAYILITLTALGVLFYLVVVVAGTSSYECPFQTPASTSLRGLWRKIGSQTTSTLLSVIIMGRDMFQALSSIVLRLWRVVKKLTIATFHQAPLDGVQEDPRTFQEINHPSKELDSSSCEGTGKRTTPTPGNTGPWLDSTALAILRETTINDIRCVSWILWSVTDPEALDAAIRLASTILWFAYGLDVKPPYNLIVSILEGCFDSAGKVYYGSRDRAYHSAQAVLWIHIRAMCVSEEFALGFPLPVIHCDTTSLDHDLGDLLNVYSGWDTPEIISWMYDIRPRFTPTYLQWTSNALLHLSWARCDLPVIFGSASQESPGVSWGVVPLNMVLNRLLTFCIFLDLPVEEEVLKIQDKS